MGETIYVRDVDPEVKARIEEEAKAAGQSVSAFLRAKFQSLFGQEKVYRKAGYLAEELKDIGEPLDGWGPMSEEDLALWEGSESYDPTRD